MELSLAFKATWFFGSMWYKYDVTTCLQLENVRERVKVLDEDELDELRVDGHQSRVDALVLDISLAMLLDQSTRVFVKKHLS